METQKQIDFERITKAIHYIHTNFKQQPNLEDVAKAIHLSPFNFQRLFSDWAGVSPKKFLQFISVDYAKNLLKKEQVTLFDTAFETGFSGTSRLHDLFVKLEGMTPAEYKNGGKSLSINYSFANSPFGKLIIASTPKGVCYMAFYRDEIEALKELKISFPNANFQLQKDDFQEKALTVFSQDWTHLSEIKLHLKGTDFQLKVWETLLNIPFGTLSSYQEVAQKIDNPKATRAVGSAIAKNPVAYLIPCHRVIRSTGNFNQYRWGISRKKAMVGWECAKRMGFTHNE